MTKIEARPRTHIIYVPGLGDGYNGMRTTALKLWRAPQTHVSFVAMNWRDATETYTQKCSRLVATIDAYPAEDVVLVGESAGGSMVIGLTSQLGDRVKKCITICGKNVRGDRVSPRLYRSNPAFKESMQRSDAAAHDIKKALGEKIVTFYSPFDPTVHLADTKLPYAKLRKILTPGHFVSITLVLFMLWPIIIKEARAE